MTTPESAAARRRSLKVRERGLVYVGLTECRIRIPNAKPAKRHRGAREAAPRGCPTPRAAAFFTNAESWVARGVQIVGDCCTIRPERIKLIAERLGGSRCKSMNSKFGQRASPAYTWFLQKNDLIRGARRRAPSWRSLSRSSVPLSWLGIRFSAFS
jgi:Homocysteine S-methyltransferase